MSIRSLKGMQDILPADIGAWQYVEKHLVELAHRYGYEEIRTPVLESLDLYARSVGEHTDIVQKEMFSFTDQGGASICARPEGTASIVRSYLQHHLDQIKPLTKLFYIGPLFRHERPQKGRFRQFYQFGVEALGKRCASIDVELMVMMTDIAKTFGLNNPRLEVNSLGDLESRNKYRDVLQKYFSAYKKDLSEHELLRLQENPLRLLDSKNPKLQDVIKDAPQILDYLNDSSKHFFDQVIEGLNLHQIDYVINPAIVRGMDYYQDTAFELKVDGLGAQDTVMGGGRYDGLSKQLGGHDIPASGFALGIERLLLSAKQIDIKPATHIVVLPLGEKEENQALLIAHQLRQHAQTSRVHFLSGNQSIKAGLRAANKYNADHVLILGEQEHKKKVVQWKHFEASEQKEVPFEDVLTTMKAFL